MKTNQRLRATPEQQQLIHDLIFLQLKQMNLKMRAITTYRDCWILFQRYLRQVSQPKTECHWPRIWPFVERPMKCGTHREWLFEGLHDSHIESVFQHVMPRKLT